MSNVTPYPHGTFSWVDLATTDAAAAKMFYTELFGWEAIDNPIPGGSYTMLTLSGQNIAGLSQLGPDQLAQGMSTVWSSYITVADVDAVTAQVAALGGTVVAPCFDVMDAGRLSFIQDPSGAFVCLWQTYGHRGSDIFNVPNSLGWNELTTRDTGAATAFYQALLGWGAAVDENNYTMWTVNGRPNGGMIAMDDDWPAEVPPHWAVYFSVADINATVEKVKALGGTITMGPSPAGDVGHIAIVVDPTGGSFTAIQMNQPDETLPGEQ